MLNRKNRLLFKYGKQGRWPYYRAIIACEFHVFVSVIKQVVISLTRREYQKLTCREILCKSGGTNIHYARNEWVACECGRVYWKYGDGYGPWPKGNLKNLRTFYE